jgi:hypothetical protein
MVRSARHQVDVELGNQIVRKSVWDRVEPLNDRQSVTYFTHDDGDGSVESISYRREDLRTGLFLAPLHLTEVAQRDTCLTCDLTEGAALLQAEVPKNVTDFLSN